MDDYWDEYHRRVDQWREAGDTERLALVDKYVATHGYRETDPERTFWALSQCRSEAQRLNEPWWVFFFDAFRLSTLTADISDYTRALPLAMELMVAFSTPEGQAHRCQPLVLNDALCIYLNIDPYGFADELEKGFAHQNTQIPDGANTDRFVLCHRWTEYFLAVERFGEASELALRTLALADQSGDQLTFLWHGAWSLFYLCRACHPLGQMDEIAGHANQLIEISKQNEHLRRTEADGYIWRAVTEIAAGEERKASQSFHQGMRLLQGLEARDVICAIPTTIYYKLKGDWKAALNVCDRELSALTKKGSLHRCCQVQLERCRLLSLAKVLTSNDLANARLLADRLRSPRWYLERLEKFE